MRLLAPAGTRSSVQRMLAAGADDVYLGSRSPRRTNYSFNGRATVAGTGRRVLPEYDELPEIVADAHQAGAGVYYLANIPFLNDGPTGTDSMQTEFAEYVEAGLSAGVDAIVVGDIGALVQVAAMNPGIPIVASSYFEVQNIAAVQLLAELGAGQVILSYQVNMGDIKELARLSPVPLEVFGHGGCSFYVGSCNLFHEAGEGGAGGIDVGYPCQGMFSVRHGAADLGKSRFLDGFTICSLCHLGELVRAPVHALKIVGRDLDPGFVSQVVGVYRSAIDIVVAGDDDPNRLMELVPGWWRKLWCEPGSRCRYRWRETA